MFFLQLFQKLLLNVLEITSCSSKLIFIYMRLYTLQVWTDLKTKPETETSIGACQTSMMLAFSC